MEVKVSAAALTMLAEQMLETHAADYVKQCAETYASDQLIELIIALYDGMNVEEVQEVFETHLTVSEMRQIRINHHMAYKIQFELERMKARGEVLEEIADSIQKSLKEAIAAATQIVQEQLASELQARNQEIRTLQKRLEAAQVQNQGQKEDGKPGLFGRRSKEKIQVNIAKGLYTPEQLEQIAEAYNSNLTNDQLEMVANPKNPDKAMKQMIRLYQAKNRKNGASCPMWTEPEKLSNVDRISKAGEVVQSGQDTEEEDTDYDDSMEG